MCAARLHALRLLSRHAPTPPTYAALFAALRPLRRAPIISASAARPGPTRFTHSDAGYSSLYASPAPMRTSRPTSARSTHSKALLLPDELCPPQSTSPAPVKVCPPRGIPPTSLCHARFIALCAALTRIQHSLHSAPFVAWCVIHSTHPVELRPCPARPDAPPASRSALALSSWPPVPSSGLLPSPSRALPRSAHFATRHLSRCLRTNILRRTSPALWRTSYLATGRPPRRMPPASSRASCYVARLVALPM
jgi:hypothetical protein